MAIYNFGFNSSNEVSFPKGAYCELHFDNNTQKFEKTKYWYSKSYEGMCIKIIEHNLYNDSNFIMVVWDEESKSAKEIGYASTRYFSGPAIAMSEADAPVEILAKYYVWEAKEKHREDVRKRWEERRKMIFLANNAHISRSDVKKLANAYGGSVDSNGCSAILRLLAQKTIRSSFRKSLKEQILKWLEEALPEYETPLSFRQMECLINY